MTRRNRVRVAVATLIAAAAGCSYPTFSYGPGTGGSGGGASSSSSGGGDTASTSSSGGAGGHGGGGTGGAATSTSGSTSASSTGGPTCAIGHLLISEVRSRGPLGAGDEFIELFNATGSDVTLDSLWTIEGRAVDSQVFNYTTRWKGKGGVIPAGGFFLITGNDPSQYSGPTGDNTLSVGITDASSLRLLHQGNTVDAICYVYDPGMAPTLLLGYTCEGTPLLNPHDDTNGTNSDKSLERAPGGTLGNCTDTDDNFSDFATQSPSTPESSKVTPVP